MRIGRSLEMHPPYDIPSRHGLVVLNEGTIYAGTHPFLKIIRLYKIAAGVAENLRFEQEQPLETGFRNGQWHDAAKLGLSGRQRISAERNYVR